METLTSFPQTTLSSLDLLDSMGNELTPQPFLKMEDLHTASSPAALSMDLMQTSPAPVIVHSKPAKKRKSWGQELPEPKTTLPPRKRAKTEDEKEQRRIERIKRNRAAAHNSRERKRQETETLAVALARANAELDAYRSLHGPLPASVVLPEVTLQIDEVDTPTPSLAESHGTIDYDTCPISPATHPENYIKQEALESTLLNLTPAFNLDVKPAQASLLPLDSTQHSAVSVERPESRCDLASSYLVDAALSLSHELSAPNLLSDHSDGHLESFAFSNGAFDASFNPSLDFSFDDFIHDAASVAIDGYGAA